MHLEIVLRNYMLGHFRPVLAVKLEGFDQPLFLISLPSILSESLWCCIEQVERCEIGVILSSSQGFPAKESYACFDLVHVPRADMVYNLVPITPI